MLSLGTGRYTLGNLMIQILKVVEKSKFYSNKRSRETGDRPFDEKSDQMAEI